MTPERGPSRAASARVAACAGLLGVPTLRLAENSCDVLKLFLAAVVRIAFCVTLTAATKPCVQAAVPGADRHHLEVLHPRLGQCSGMTPERRACP